MFLLWLMSRDKRNPALINFHFMVGLRRNYKAFYFASRYLIIFIIIFWTTGPKDLWNSYRQWQNANRFSIRWAGTIQVFLKKIALHFQVELKIIQVRYLENGSTNSRFVTEYAQGTRVYKKYWRLAEVAAQLSLHFSSGKLSRGKRGGKSLTSFNRFSSNVYHIIALCLTI